MPFINLIQEQRLEAQRKERQIQLALMGTLAAGAICLVATAGLMLDATRLSMRAAALEKQKQDLEPLIAELEENEAEIERLTPRLETLQEAQKYSAKWSSILAHLTTNVPSNAYLTSVKANQHDRTKPLVITFTGITTSQEVVGDIFLRLQTCPELTNVSLRFTQPRLVDSGRYLDFELEAEMAGTGETEDGPKEKSA